MRKKKLAMQREVMRLELQEQVARKQAIEKQRKD
jgi:hypothetical protein